MSDHLNQTCRPFIISTSKGKIEIYNLLGVTKVPHRHDYNTSIIKTKVRHKKRDNFSDEVENQTTNVEEHYMLTRRTLSTRTSHVTS